MRFIYHPGVAYCFGGHPVCVGWTTCIRTRNFVIAGRMRCARVPTNSPATSHCRCQYRAVYATWRRTKSGAACTLI